MGITLWDRDRVWMHGEESAPTNLKRMPNNFYRSAQRFATEYDGDPYARDRRPRTKSRVRTLNEHGHDYTRSEDDTTRLDEAAIADVHALLRDRLEAKLARDFSEADALLAELGSMGVAVNDGTKAWRADGASFERRYKRSGRGGDVDERRVDELILQRTRARKQRDYRRADAILAELLEEHGVALVDAEYTWRWVGAEHDGAYGEGSSYGRLRQPEASRDGHDYARDRGDRSELRGAALDEIDRLLAARLAAKKSRNFSAADALQVELRDSHGVEVDDRRRVWFVAGSISEGEGELHVDDDDYAGW